MTGPKRRTAVVVAVVLGVLVTTPVVVALLIHFLTLKRIEEARAGGIYSVVSKSGEYSVLKVLKVEPGAVHVRVYKGRWSTRPTQVDPDSLTIGQLDQEDGGIGHLPLAPRVFAAWAPQLILVTEVKPTELDGYAEWKHAGGGVWNQ